MTETFYTLIDEQVDAEHREALIDITDQVLDAAGIDRDLDVTDPASTTFRTATIAEALAMIAAIVQYKGELN